MKHLPAGLLLAALLAGCTSPSLPTPPAPPVQETASPIVYFELDTTTNTIRPIDPTGQQRVGKQTVYRAGNGFTFTESIKEQVDGVYQVQFTLTNTTQQDMGVDGEITATFVNFQARDASNAPVPGGGVVNASGHQANTYFPYIALTNSNIEGTNPLPIEPATSFKFTVGIQVPAPATKALLGFVVRAAQKLNTVPTSPSTWMTPAFGKYGSDLPQEGTEENSRFSQIYSMTTCPGSDTLYLTDDTGLWMLQGHRSRFLKNAPEYTGISQLTCNENGLFVSEFQERKIYRIDPITYLPTPIAGTGVLGLDDGPGATATFSYPNHISSQGQTLVVSEYNVNTIRLLKRHVDGTYHVSTRHTHTGSGNLYAATMDPAGNIYYTSDSGLWRLANGARTAVNVHTGPLTSGIPMWHPSGYVVVSVYSMNQVYAYAPGNADPTLGWNRVVVAGNGSAATPAAYGVASSVPLPSPFGFTFDQHGTLFVASLPGNLVFRVDRLR